MILSQFDHQQTAIINPGDVIQTLPDFPKAVVTCFAKGIFARILAELPYHEITKTSVVNLKILIYELDFQGQEIAFFNSYVGAGGYVAILEDITTTGVENILVFSTCGALDSNTKEALIIIPISAIRDEGASCHYTPPASEIALNHTYRKQSKQFLDAQNIPYTKRKVWMTDGIYRGTHQKAANRKTRGAITVDMECSTIAAFANPHRINHFQFFYSADNLDAEVWESRTLANGTDLETKDRTVNIVLSFAVELLR